MKKNTFNYSAVNARAAALYREITAEYPEARNRATWTACMREAVKEYREAVKNYTARAEWEAMTGEEQLETLKRAAANMPDFLMSVSYINGNGEKDFRLDKTVLWMVPESRGGQGIVPWTEAVDTVAAEAWIILVERMEAYDGGKPLVALVYNACRAAVHRLDRLYHDAPRTKRTKDGKQIALYGGAAGACEWNDMNAARAPRSLAWKAESPEAAYISREAVEELTHDENDKRIVNALERGYTQKEAAAALGISQPAIAKRVRNMKNRRENAAAIAEAEAEAAAVAEWMNGGELEKPAARRARLESAAARKEAAEEARKAAAANPAAARFAKAEAAPEAPEAAARRRADMADTAAANAAALEETARRAAEEAETPAARKAALTHVRRAAADARRARIAANDARRALNESELMKYRLFTK